MPIAGASFTSSAPSSTFMEKTDNMAPPPPPSSWQNMEYGGLQLAPLPDCVIVKNTFIDCPNARSSSLDEYAESRGWKSCPNSGIMGQPEQHPNQQHVVSEIQSLVIPEVESASSDDAGETSSSSPDEGEKELGELPLGCVVKNTFIDYPTVRSSSLDEYIEERWGWKSCPVSRMQSEAENQLSEIQTAVIAEEAPEGSLSGGSEEEEKTTLRLLELLPRPLPVFSVGSLLHQLGQQCKPCGFVHKPEGCTNGAQCQYCHLCPPGTIKHRKKVKKVMLRQVWQHGPVQQGWF